MTVIQKMMMQEMKAGRTHDLAEEIMQAMSEDDLRSFAHTLLRLIDELAKSCTCRTMRAGASIN